MNADSFYKKGYSHINCEDYASSENLEDRSFTLICDGCSSAKDSDWGARLLNRAVALQLKRGEFDYRAISHGLTVADSYRKTLDFDEECLYSTVGMVTNYKERLITTLCGDGFIVARERESKNLNIYETYFTSGAPYYIAYRLTAESKRSYLDTFKNSEVREVQFIFTPTGEIKEGEDESVSPDFPVELYCGYEERLFLKEKYDLVAVISDGLKSFVKKEKTATSITTKPINYFDIIKYLFDFKGYKGPFVKRRCQKAFQQFNELGWDHYDDFSIGVIYEELG